MKRGEGKEKEEKRRAGYTTTTPSGKVSEIPLKAFREFPGFLRVVVRREGGFFSSERSLFCLLLPFQGRPADVNN